MTSIELILIVVPECSLTGQQIIHGVVFSCVCGSGGHILSASDDVLNGGCSFEIMVEHKAFVSVANSLDVEDQKMPVAVTSR